MEQDQKVMDQKPVVEKEDVNNITFLKRRSMQ